MTVRLSITCIGRNIVSMGFQFSWICLLGGGARPVLMHINSEWSSSITSRCVVPNTLAPFIPFGIVDSRAGAGEHG
jgi:hypothetical protein